MLTTSGKMVRVRPATGEEGAFAWLDLLVNSRQPSMKRSIF